MREKGILLTNPSSHWVPLVTCWVEGIAAILKLWGNNPRVNRPNTLIRRKFTFNLFDLLKKHPPCMSQISLCSNSQWLYFTARVSLGCWVRGCVTSSWKAWWSKQSTQAYAHIYDNWAVPLQSVKLLVCLQTSTYLTGLVHEVTGTEGMVSKEAQWGTAFAAGYPPQIHPSQCRRNSRPSHEIRIMTAINS